jgi:hypothetical protein
MVRMGDILAKIVDNQNKIINNQTELKMALVFNSTITGCEWLKYKNFSPVGFAVAYSCLYTLFRVLNETRPTSILEFGLGQSSKLIHQYAAFFTDARAITCEHDTGWIDFFQKNLNADYTVNIQTFELEEIFYKDKPTLSYKNLLSGRGIGEKRFDFIMIDGPFGSEHFSRPQIIPLLKNNLKDTFCIIMDDYNRPGERETIEEVMDILRGEGRDFSRRVYAGEKEHVLICSKNLHFLTTLS